MSKIVPLLLIGFIISACSGIPVSTWVPETLGTPTSPSGADCDFPTNWALQFSRSGGIAGWDESMTLDSGGRLRVQSERPPTDLQTTVSENQIEKVTDLLTQACPFEVQESDTQCADCFAYELVIQMNGGTYQVEANEITLTEELHSLVNVLSELLQDTGK